MLSEQPRASPYLDFSTAEYRLNSVIMDVAHHRLFKPLQITDTPTKSCRQFLKLKVARYLSFYLIDFVKFVFILQENILAKENNRKIKVESHSCVPLYLLETVF
jgi:hypothetical protein